MTNNNWIDIAVGTTLAWGVGLGAALVLRYWLLKRPIGRWIAGVFSASIWFALFAGLYGAWIWIGEADTFAGRSHIGILLVSIAAYYVLTRPDSNAGEAGAMPSGSPARTSSKIESNQAISPGPQPKRVQVSMQAHRQPGADELNYGLCRTTEKAKRDFPDRRRSFSARKRLC